jgi:hypothetical protein
MMTRNKGKLHSSSYFTSSDKYAGNVRYGEDLVNELSAKNNDVNQEEEVEEEERKE